MNKPTIFFSHSTRDEKPLRALKDSLNDKVGGTIDIFLSSDGQSIPFGKNWVHKIEEALGLSKIMFVFLSPNSIHSNWLYFEAGFSYSKGIEVIPVGILGVDLNQISPPLNLLQGFNIDSMDGLNNIITIINQKFGYSHKESFTGDDYSKIFAEIEFSEFNLFRDFAKDIDYIRFELVQNISNSKSVRASNYVEIIEKYFGEQKIDYGNLKHDIYTHGLTINIQKEKDNEKCFIFVDPLLTKRSFKIIKDILNEVYTENLERYFFYVYFKDPINFLKPTFKVSSRFFDTDVKISDRGLGLYKYGKIVFALDEEKDTWTKKKEPEQYLRVVYEVNELDSLPFFELIKMLFECGVLYK